MYLCLHFARQDGKKRKENHATKETKIQKNKRRKYGMNETYNAKFYILNIIYPKLMSHNQNHTTAQVQLQGATVEVGWSLKPPCLLQIN